MGCRSKMGTGKRPGSTGSNSASGEDYLAKQAARDEVEILDDGLLIEHLLAVG